MSSRPATEPFRVVTTDEGLRDAVVSCVEANRVGLDTEFLREKTYRPRLCLLQLATSEVVFVVDPLEDVRLDPLIEMLGDPATEIVVHAGRQDLELFFEQFGARPRSIFDVQIAAGFAGYGASLSYGRLVEAVLGVALVKGESYTEWCRRPLTAAQMSYAADDVRYLVAAAEKLMRRLEEQDRLDWAREEMASLERDETYVIDSNEMWRKVAGRGTLSGRHTAVLREIARWREETASTRNIPRGWVVKDPTLIEIARRAPGSIAKLKDIRGLNTREADRSGPELLAAIERGKKAPAFEKGAAPLREAQVRARMLIGLADAVVRARAEAAQIAPELVATRADVEVLLTEIYSGALDEASHRILRGWRRELVGEAILGLARGRIAVKAIDRPPFIEEVELNDD